MQYMNTEVVEINCLCKYFSFDLLHSHLSNFNESKYTEVVIELIADLKIDGENIRLNLFRRRRKDIYVYWHGLTISLSNRFRDVANEFTQLYKENCSSAPIIFVCKNTE